MTVEELLERLRSKVAEIADRLGGHTIDAHIPDVGDATMAVCIVRCPDLSSSVCADINEPFLDSDDVDAILGLRAECCILDIEQERHWRQRKKFYDDNNVPCKLGAK
jgi:hypothetical protein